MRRRPTILIAIGLCLVLSSYSVIAAPIPSLKLSVLDSEIHTGVAFDIDVIAVGVAALDEVLAFGFDVIHSSSFKFNNATVGTGFNDDSAMFPNTDVAGSAFPGIEGGDDITLATLNFTPFLVGTFSLVIYTDLAVPNEGLFTLDIPQIDITTCSKVGVNVVPIPTTLLLLGTSLVGLVAFRRRFRQ